MVSKENIDEINRACFKHMYKYLYSLSHNHKLLGVKIDNKLNFDLHINDKCKTASGQLNALLRLEPLLDFNAKNILIQSFIYANFNYCPIIWHFSSSKSLQKIESLQKRALRFLYNDQQSSYNALLSKGGQTTMNIYRLNVFFMAILNDLSITYGTG